MDTTRLKSIPLFAGLSDRDLRQVAQWADEVEVQEGKQLVRQGEFAYEFFVIEEGKAEVTKDGRHLGELGPGDFFGEIALLAAEHRTASVTATSPMRLIVMFGREFRSMAKAMPHVAEEIQRAIGERLGR
ncbi:MAG: cyclic nucleotide-binding domain-containing protein [Acidimicrobiia bacterium]